MVKKIVNERSEILEPLYAVAKDLIKVDKRGKGYLIKYTNSDVTAAVVVFNHIITNRMAWQLHDSELSIDEIKEIAEDYQKKILHLVAETTGFDMNKEIKKHG